MATINSTHSLEVAENLLYQRFAVSQPGTVYAADITSIPTDDGWLYLAGVKDPTKKPSDTRWDLG